MPDFNTFRMNEALLGRSYAFRKLNPCMDGINVNNPKFNKKLKVRTIVHETFDTYEEWIDYIMNGHKIDLEELNKKNVDKHSK
jgi:hypothetical protein